MREGQLISYTDDWVAGQGGKERGKTLFKVTQRDEGSCARAESSLVEELWGEPQHCGVWKRLPVWRDTLQGTVAMSYANKTDLHAVTVGETHKCKFWVFRTSVERIDFFKNIVLFWAESQRR